MASTYLSRTFSNATDRKKWTISVWLKRSSTSGNQTIVSGNSSQNKIHFLGSDNTLDIVQWSGSYQYRLRTSRVFRDTSAWYHLVIAVDTTLSTADNRVRLYVNGVEETSFADRNNPSQNFATSWNDSEANFICKEGDNYFGGSMSHFHFCDGTALAPTVFGSTDSTTGEWQINTSPSFTLGTNGFTILKDGTTITDQSTNSNNWSLGGGTLTKTEDNPSNVFCTFNRNVTQTAGTSGRDSSSSTSMDYGNTRIGEGAAVFSPQVGTIFANSGKYYFEVKGGGDNYQSVGICNPNFTDASLGSAQGMATQANSNSIGMYGSGGQVRKNGTQIYVGSTFASQIVCVAMDLDNHFFYIRLDDGSWLNSGDPTSGATGTGGVSITPDFYTFGVTTHNNGGSGRNYMSANFGNGFFGTTAVASAGTNASGNGIFEYNVPTGFTALSTKGLNL